MLTQQQLEEIREDDERLGDEIRFRPEVYTHRRQLLELIKEMQTTPPAPEAPAVTICTNCFVVYGAALSDRCPVCGLVRQ